MRTGFSAEEKCEEPASGGVLGVWRLTRRIHQGTWSELFAAQPADAVGSPRSDYVVKRVRTSADDPQAARTQLCTEASVLARVQNPHVIAVLDACVEGPTPYFTMPRLDGENLQQWLDRRRWQALPVCLWLVRQAAQGLAALHALGWRHGDLKPANLMIGPRGHLTIVDLGLASRCPAPSGDVFRGTPEYAAPEQFTATPEGVGAAADIYSLGVLLVQLLSRQPAAAIRAGGQDAPAPSSLRAAAVISPVVELVEAMTTERPADRPTAGTLAEQLLKLEIETLGSHIQPIAQDDRRAA